MIPHKIAHSDHALKGAGLHHKASPKLAKILPRSGATNDRSHGKILDDCRRQRSLHAVSSQDFKQKKSRLRE
jgi:hypothetical protein